MRHIEAPELETERLRLRHLSVDDDKEMFENWASDPQVTLHLTWPTYTEVEAVQEWLLITEAAYEFPGGYTWGLEIKETGDLIGTIGAHGLDADEESCEVGYAIGRRWWGQGYVAEALAALLEFLFDELGVSVVRACHHPDNPNSGRVMEKCGMVPAPHITREMTDNSGTCIAVFREITAREWASR